MGRGKAVSDEEYWWIVGLSDGGVSLREIAKRSGRSRPCVTRVVTTERGPQAVDGGSSSSKKAGRQLAVSEREARLLVRAAATGQYSAAELKAKHGCKASVRTIQRLLQRVDFLDYTKMDRTLPLTAAHKQARMEWAETHILAPGQYSFICLLSLPDH